ncbi:MAG TPA: MerR family transcriptional regulator [Caldilineaceae bacterium]|nr:MerR family transcriptional regulator [Caldilineaceae bacterium]
MLPFTIGEIARRAGVAPSTIRYYEQIGLLPPAQRVNGKRRYDADILRQLNVIRLAQQAGFTLEEIRRLLDGFAPDAPPAVRWRAVGERKRAELDALLAAVQRQRAILEALLRCRCANLDECAAGAA